MHTALLFPERSVVRGLFPKRPVAAWLLRFWLTPTWRTRRAQLIANFRGTESPLDWMWRGRDPAEEQAHGALTGSASIVKLALYQVWLYVRGLLALASSGGRRDLRFWSADPV